MEETTKRLLRCVEDICRGLGLQVKKLKGRDHGPVYFIAKDEHSPAVGIRFFRDGAEGLGELAIYDYSPQELQDNPGIADAQYEGIAGFLELDDRLQFWQAEGSL